MRAGIGVDTPLPGFSMTKSVVNALIGVLTQQGLVTPSMPAPIPEWRGADDPRREIEVEHLMRMTSGPRSRRNQFRLRSIEPDVSAGRHVRLRRQCEDDRAARDARWRYSSATTQILARIVRDAVGGPEQTLAFAWRELFNPLGMRNVTLEFDGTGTLQGANYMLASARDWAKFGLLYLNDGVVGGKRILHRGLGGFLRRRDARHRLRRRLLDQSQRASQREGPRAARHARAMPSSRPAISASAS